MTAFELAGGSVVGTDHRAVPKNNQDAWYVSQDEDVTVAVVCDGCGSGAYSEIGARLGARLICESIRRGVLTHGEYYHWSRVERDVLSAFHTLAVQMGGRYREVVYDHFLFTITGVLIYGQNVTFFGLGDGIVVANGVVTQYPVEGWPDNAPPYLAYQLLDDRTRNFDYRELHLGTIRRYPAEWLESFLIGCDGAGRPGLLGVCEEDRKLPGTEVSVGSISRFWEDDDFFSNPDALRRRLKLIARDWPTRNPERGLLADDTTIVVGRRKREEL